MIDLKESPFRLSDMDIAWVEETKKSLSLEEKLEQLFFAMSFSDDEQYVEHKILSKNPGGLMFYSGEAKKLYEIYHMAQNKTKIPLLLAANLEAGGNGAVKDGTVFGKQMQVAATGDRHQAYRLGKVACSEAQAVGCNYALAPVADLDMNYHNPITNVRTYGSDPETVKTFGMEYMRAAKECGMAVAVKHFPGDGMDEVDQHLLTSVNSLSCEEWDRTYGKVYNEFIQADALSIMVGHIALPSYQTKFNPEHQDRVIPASLSPELLQKLLREQMGFNGMIITDSSRMAGFMCAMEREKAVPYCIEAGCDMLLFSKNYEEDLEFMKKGYETGILSERRVDEALTRILAVKAALRLHEKRLNGTLCPLKENLGIIGCEKHKMWAGECAEKSVTLVKDTQKLLPLSPKKQKRVLLEMLGRGSSEARVLKRFKTQLEKEGFEVICYEEEKVDFSKGADFETVAEFRNKYDLVIYIGNVETMSNKTTNRLDWHVSGGMGNNFPWFVEEVPTMFISLQNPYHLLDVPMIKTYINAYSNHDIMIDTVVEKILGRSLFTGKSPIDPFCGKDYLKY